MSGGSFNYLCYADDRRDGGWAAALEDMRDMAKALREAGAADAADGTDAVVAAYERIAHEQCEPLRGVWKALEWYRSGDWGPEALRDALREYNGKAQRVRQVVADLAEFHGLDLRDLPEPPPPHS